ncbi:hypothetical protein ACJIZ3_012566 [Penstemon smallii]|uniref:RING-type E3 ubiquitin transferase n=1 Tax=Penstemon smallii TaxID=265156 RepID=A0ABD3UME3_9LAMI
MVALLSQPNNPNLDLFLSGFSVGSVSHIDIGVKVYVAVGKSVDKTVSLLQWTFRTFHGQEVCLLHVHRPSPLIPTLLGRFPASQASPEMVAAFRNEEREETMKLLSSYLLTCSRSKVKASIITTEADEVEKGILDLVNIHTIRKLIVGAIPDCTQGKNISRKATHIAKHAPPFCELCFVKKGKLIWTRQSLEAAHYREVNLRTDAENALRFTRQQQEKLLEEKEKTTHQLQKTMRNIALLDTHAQEANHRLEDLAGELKLIQSSIATLRHEKNKIQRKKIEATRWLDRWKSCGRYEETNDSKLFELPVFVLSDLETATCGFSESFVIGRGGYGVVYKGEILDKTVAIKKFHSYNMLRQTEFHRMEQVLGKLHHPYLVELIGVSPESWSLVYEYMPNGSLQDYLSNNNSISALNWKIRARIVADIASGLLFLHSSRPKTTVHGNLKPENILLDRNNRCKISDYGDNMLVATQALRCPSFRHCTTPCQDFSYTDPESYRTGAVTPKSDIYSFGLIILQLVTGRSLRGLIGEVHRAVSYGNITSVLDLSGGEWSSYVARRLVELGLQFCESNSRDRLELTPSLVKELERLPFLEEQITPSFFLCPILQEIMHDPQVAADGFTYEGEALRGWLGNGHETSPMTNLKLSHLNLTPNYALKLAIQDWVCKS